jgi:carnitine-CoA ligase
MLFTVTPRPANSSASDLPSAITPPLDAAYRGAPRVVARVSDDGALRFVGRRDDVIKVSGENVSLTEIEAILAQAPGVLECAVLGRPDPVRDTVPVAYVVPRDREHPPAAEDLAQWSAQNLAAPARPRDWHLIDELPRTSVGKVRPFKL